MKISKRIQYALEFILNLGLRWPEYSAVSEIADRNNLPSKYLETIAAELRKAGLVDVKRGAGGGYRLSISLKEMTLLDVFCALDSDWNEVEKQFSENTQSEKSVATFLSTAVKIVHKSASTITLQSLLDDYRNNLEILYHI